MLDTIFYCFPIVVEATDYEEKLTVATTSKPKHMYKSSLRSAPASINEGSNVSAYNRVTAEIFENLISVDALAERMSVSRGTVYNWMKCGLPSRRVGRVRRFLWTEARAWLEKWRD